MFVLQVPPTSLIHKVATRFFMLMLPPPPVASFKPCCYSVVLMNGCGCSVLRSCCHHFHVCNPTHRHRTDARIVAGYIFNCWSKIFICAGCGNATSHSINKNCCTLELSNPESKKWPFSFYNILCLGCLYYHSSSFSRQEVSLDSLILLGLGNVFRCSLVWTAPLEPPGKMTLAIHFCRSSTRV